MLVVLLVVAACASGGSSATVAAGGPAAAQGWDLQSIARGDALFNSGSCQRCHGQQGVGAQNGPSLVSGVWLHVDGTQERIAAIIASGVPSQAIKDSTRRFAMRARGGPMNLTDAQIQDVANYVVSISRGKTNR